MSLLQFVTRLFGGPRHEALSAEAPTPTFELKDAEGKKYSLQEALKRGPVLLAFFKVTCPTCRFTFPYLERLYRGIQNGNKVQLWGISQNDAGKTVEFGREHELSFPLLLDEEGYPVSNAYGLTNVPTLFLVRPNGTLQLSSKGFSRKDIETVAAELGRLNGQPIPVFHPGESVPDYKPG